MNNETVIHLQKVDVKVGKNNNVYVVCMTDQGKMSCFKDGSKPGEQDTISFLKKHEGEVVRVRLRQSGNYTNIDFFHGMADKHPEPNTEVIEVGKPSRVPTPTLTEKSSEIASNEVSGYAFKGKLKENSKGYWQCEVSVQANSIEEYDQRLGDALAVTKEHASKLNLEVKGNGIPPEEVCQ